MNMNILKKLFNNVILFLFFILLRQIYNYVGIMLDLVSNVSNVAKTTAVEGPAV